LKATKSLTSIRSKISKLFKLPLFSPSPASPSYLEILASLREKGEQFIFLPIPKELKLKEALLKEIKERLVEPTLENLRYAFDVEVSIRAITKFLIHEIIGAGWEFQGDPLATSKVEDFFKHKFVLDDFIDISITNLIRDGNVLWKYIHSNKELVNLIPIAWEYVTIYRHPLKGWKTFIIGGSGKELYIPSEFYKAYKLKKEFTLEDWEKIPAKRLESLYVSLTPIEPYRYNENEILHIAIDTRGEEKGHSPLEPILTLIFYKKALEYIACRCYELYSSPILSLKTGLEKAPPTTDEEVRELQKRVEEGADMLKEFKEFGIFSFPFDQDLKVHFPSARLPDFIPILQFLGAEIILCVLGSRALFEARGVELATSRTIKSVWDEAVDGWRRILKRAIDEIIIKYLESINVKARCEIIFKRREWSVEEIKTRLKALMRGEVT